MPTNSNADTVNQFSRTFKRVLFTYEIEAILCKGYLCIYFLPLSLCRLPFSMLVLQKAVKMTWSLRKVMCIAYAFILVMLIWMALWSFGAAGVVASSIGDGGRWWLLMVSGQVCCV